MRAVPVALLGLLCAACASGPGTDAESFPVPQIEWAPLHHACPRATGSVVIDGRLDDAAWVRAPWTSDFRDIRGGSHPTPRFRTRAKMLWDDEFLYLGAELSEPDVWGTLVDRDSVVYQDNDFEIFIDPDGDTHEYYELEINALGTEWDLLVPKPYRDAGHGVNAWDIRGLRTAVHVDGTLNRPGDRDLGWSVEIAIPWGVLAECANREAPRSPGTRGA